MELPVGIISRAGNFLNNNLGFMKEEIRRLIVKVVMKLKKAKKWPDFQVPEFSLDCSKNDKFGDYSTNVAMVLAPIVKKNPIVIAEELIKRFDLSRLQRAKEVKPRLEIFERIEVASPGYINFYLSKKYLQKNVADINRKGRNYGNSRVGKGIRVNNEFISANPTGPLTIGNARGGPFGDVLGNVLKKAGFKKP